MQIKRSLASLAAKAGLQKISTALQGGPRAAQSDALNYMSVQTLDPSRLARAFAAADTGDIAEQAKLFELVEEHDAHIFSELAKRRRSVTGLGWQLQPPDDATQAELDRANELEAMLRSIPRFEDAQYDLTDAIGKGFAALEIEWRTGESWTPAALHWVPQRMMQVERDTGRLQLKVNGMPEALRDNGWVVHEHRSKSGYIEQAALFRVLAWTYAYKAYNTLDMQKFLEKYGLPLRLGKYPSGIGKAEQDSLLKAVRAIGSDGAGVVPSTMSIDFVQATKTGTVSDFLSAIDYWERKQSMAILGGTLTSQADGKTSTNALGVIHDKVRREIMLHDVRQIEPTITQQLVKPIALYNGMFALDRMPKFVYETAESVDQQAMVNVLKTAASLGMRIGVKHAHQVLQIPEAQDGEDILAEKNQPGGKPNGSPNDNPNNSAVPPAQVANTRAAVEQLVALSKASGSTDLLTAYLDQLTQRAAPHEQDLVQQIAALVAESGDFEEAIAKLEQFTIATRPKALAEQIALGLTAVNLAGRAGE